MWRETSAGRHGSIEPSASSSSTFHLRFISLSSAACYKGQRSVFLPPAWSEWKTALPTVFAPARPPRQPASGQPRLLTLWRTARTARRRVERNTRTVGKALCGRSRTASRPGQLRDRYRAGEGGRYPVQHGTEPQRSSARRNGPSSLGGRRGRKRHPACPYRARAPGDRSA